MFRMTDATLDKRLRKLHKAAFEVADAVRQHKLYPVPYYTLREGAPGCAMGHVLALAGLNMLEARSADSALMTFLFGSIVFSEEDVARLLVHSDVTRLILLANDVSVMNDVLYEPGVSSSERELRRRANLADSLHAFGHQAMWMVER